MKKLFNYIYNYILAMLFILFAYLNVSIINEDTLFFEISTIIVSLLVFAFCFIINNSKAITNRKIFLISIALSSLYLILIMIQCIFINKLYDLNIFNYLKYFVFGGSVSSLIILLFLTLKKLLSKNYTISQLDFKNFNMIIDLMAFISINLILTYNLTIKLDPVTFNNIVIFDINKNAILFTLLGYSIAYAVIYIIYYYKFDKNK